MFSVNLTMIVKDDTLSEFLNMGNATRVSLLLLNLLMFFIGLVGIV